MGYNLWHLQRHLSWHLQRCCVKLFTKLVLIFIFYLAFLESFIFSWHIFEWRISVYWFLNIYRILFYRETLLFVLAHYLTLLRVTAYEILTAHAQVLLLRPKIVHDVLLPIICALVEGLRVENSAGVPHRLLGFGVFLLEDVVDFIRAIALEVGEPTSFEKGFSSQRSLVLVLLMQLCEFFINVKVVRHILNVKLNGCSVDRVLLILLNLLIVFWEWFLFICLFLSMIFRTNLLIKITLCLLLSTDLIIFIYILSLLLRLYVLIWQRCLLWGPFLSIHEFILRVIIEVLVLQREFYCMIPVVLLLEHRLVLVAHILVCELPLHRQVQVVRDVLNWLLMVGLVQLHVLFQHILRVLLRLV